MRILVIDDELIAASYLQKGLTESGYVVDTANDGPGGLQLARENIYDLIVLDVMLPGMTGWDLMENLHKDKILCPVLFLTARDGVGDRVKGFALGAEDYLVKPFFFAELEARVHRILRRSQVRETALLEVGPLKLDLKRRVAIRSGRRVDLTAKEFLLLQLLARHSGEVLSRSAIASQVWDINFDNDSNVVDVTIRRLREKIDEPFTDKLIHTVRGMGYVVEIQDPDASV